MNHAFRRFDRDLDRICRAAVAREPTQPAAPTVAAALRDVVAGGGIALAGSTSRPYPTELLRRIGNAYSRAVNRATQPAVHYTPGPVADRLATLVAAEVGRGEVLDPACGTGSLLLAWRDGCPEAPVQGWDLDVDALHLAEALLAWQARERGSVADSLLVRRDLFLTTPERDCAVLVNPPYGTQLPPSARAFAGRARLSPREPDLFALALEHVLSWDVRGVGAIVPDAIRMQPELARLREGLGANGWLRRIEPLPFGTFPRATVRPCLLVGARGSVVNRLHVDALGRWPADHRAADLWRRCLAAATPLGELCRCHEGVHTGNIRHKLLTDRADEADARPLLKGADIGRYRMQFRGRYVRYRACHIDRAAGEYASLRDPDVFRGPKLLSRQTSDHLVVCLDRGEYVTDNSLHTLRMRDAGVAIEWLALLLNSSLATALYRSQSEERDRPLPQIKLALLRRLPIRLPARCEADVCDLFRRAEAEAGRGGLGAATEAAIDALVFDSYEVPESDREWIRSDLGAARKTRSRFAEERE